MRRQGSRDRRTIVAQRAGAARTVAPLLRPDRRRPACHARWILPDPGGGNCGGSINHRASCRGFHARADPPPRALRPPPGTLERPVPSAPRGAANTSSARRVMSRSFNSAGRPSPCQGSRCGQRLVVEGGTPFGVLTSFTSPPRRMLAGGKRWRSARPRPSLAAAIAASTCRCNGTHRARPCGPGRRRPSRAAAGSR